MRIYTEMAVFIYKNPYLSKILVGNLRFSEHIMNFFFNYIYSCFFCIVYVKKRYGQVILEILTRHNDEIHV